jgi:hypothetical protein
MVGMCDGKGETDGFSNGCLDLFGLMNSSRIASFVPRDNSQFLAFSALWTHDLPWNMLSHNGLVSIGIRARGRGSAHACLGLLPSQ